MVVTAARKRTGEEGSATVVGVSIILGVVAVAALLGVQVTGVVRQHRADAAADLTVLSAAAVQAVLGTEQACRHAADIAERNGGSLTVCQEITGGGVDAPYGSSGEPGVYIEVMVAGDKVAAAAAGPLSPATATTATSHPLVL